MKHAFLIIAHSQYEILKVLVELLDHPNSDIFILIDKKSPLPKNLICRFSTLHLLSKRIDIRWGDISQIKAELLLFKTALSFGGYSYYHLLSGVDLPIKPLNYIFDFFKRNDGKEFVGFEDGEKWWYKVFYYHLFTRYFKLGGKLGKNIDFIRKYSEIVVNKIWKRKPDSNIVFKKGANWCSVTEAFVKYLISKEKFILKRFKYTMCGDEIFLQTILWNSPFKENIYHLNDEYRSNLREVDWKRGDPYVWGSSSEDFELLKNSDKLFARKFSSQFSDIINKIKELCDFNE